MLARYDLAVDAIMTFHTGVSQDFLLRQDQFKELRDRLLKSAADFYGKLSALLGQETNLASRRALARSNFELARLTRMVGRPDHALTAYRSVLAAGGAGGRAWGRCDDDGRRRPKRHGHRRAARGDRANLLRKAGRLDNARAACERARALREPLVRDRPRITNYRGGLAETELRSGQVLLARGAQPVRPPPGGGPSRFTTG